MMAGTATGLAARSGRIRSRLAWIGLLAVTSVPGQEPGPFVDPRSVAPYVPTPWHVVDRVLDEVRVTEADTVYDLGSGDGRFLVRAAKERGARGVGYELNPGLVEEARSSVRAAGVSDRVEIRHGDIFDADLSPASVVTLFLVTSANRRLRPKLLAELRPGSRVACYKWGVPGWNPSKTVTVHVSGTEQPIFVYEIGRHD